MVSCLYGIKLIWHYANSVSRLYGIMSPLVLCRHIMEIIYGIAEPVQCCAKWRRAYLVIMPTQHCPYMATCLWPSWLYGIVSIPYRSLISCLYSVRPIQYCAYTVPVSCLCYTISCPYGVVPIRFLPIQYHP